MNKDMTEQMAQAVHRYFCVKMEEIGDKSLPWDEETEEHREGYRAAVGAILGAIRDGATIEEMVELARKAAPEISGKLDKYLDTPHHLGLGAGADPLMARLLSLSRVGAGYEMTREDRAALSAGAAAIRILRGRIAILASMKDAAKADRSVEPVQEVRR